MTIDEIRTTLLQQHAALREIIAETRAATSKWKRKECPYDHVLDCLTRLASDLSTHNHQEEQALQTILPTLDAWGPVRAESMIEEHMAEHHDLWATLIDASTTVDPAVAAVNIWRLLDRMLDHMVREETTFLDGNVLTDEQPVDGFGG